MLDYALQYAQVGRGVSLMNPSMQCSVQCRLISEPPVPRGVGHGRELLDVELLDALHEELMPGLDKELQNLVVVATESKLQESVHCWYNGTKESIKTQVREGELGQLGFAPSASTCHVEAPAE